MRIPIVVAAACLLAAFTTPRVTSTSEASLKDRGAMMIYEGRDRVLSLLPYADSANLALIVLTQIQGDAVAKPQLAGRPCVGVALFSKTEWAQLTTGDRKPTDVRPSEASMRLRLYPATNDVHAAVENIRDGAAYVAVGLELPSPNAKGPLKWSVQSYVDSARGPCTVE